MLCNLISQTVSDECRWIAVGFDGVAYRIVKEMTENTVKCLECGDIIDLKEESFEEHLNKLHHDEVNIGIENFFGNLLLAPGPEHIEKNFPVNSV